MISLPTPLNTRLPCLPTGRRQLGKFSYAEFDRFIMYLETELQALKNRAEQIERRIAP